MRIQQVVNDVEKAKISEATGIHYLRHSLAIGLTYRLLLEAGPVRVL